MDITQLILDDHHEQRRLFAILEQVERSETGALSAIWDRLTAFLELHAAAEEEIFYPALLQVGLEVQRKAGLPQPYTTAEAARLALATTRRVVITLLEWLDRQGVTLQLADDRRIVRQQPGSP